MKESGRSSSPSEGLLFIRGRKTIKSFSDMHVLWKKSLTEKIGKSHSGIVIFLTKTLRRATLRSLSGHNLNGKVPCKKVKNVSQVTG